MLVLVGGLINLLDRLRFGGVRDYWRIAFFDLFNNINDYVIFVALSLFAYKNIWKKLR